MNVVINKGFNNLLAKIIISRNGNVISNSSIRNGYCYIDAKKDDKIEISLKFPDTSSANLATIQYNESYETTIIVPSLGLKILEVMAYMIGPYLSLILLALKGAYDYYILEWICVSLISLTALSLLFLRGCMFIPFIRRRLFIVQTISKEE